MPRRKFDTSRAVCDVCGKPYKEGDAVYSLADKLDENITDRDVLVTFRHWDCHTPPAEAMRKAIKAFDEKRPQVDAIIDKLRRMGL